MTHFDNATLCVDEMKWTSVDVGKKICELFHTEAMPDPYETAVAPEVALLQPDTSMLTCNLHTC